ncbi:MAG TPA: SDR family NAD(P)-dependent oxidoreductase [Mesorhizobium sp.]|jgi:CDP-paratose 2-epimerase|nr:SDR family NAD(P)-dependent oxidoreductase [Mesorhizobium sp.]
MKGPAVVGRAQAVLITGGSGFIGANLAESFLAEGRDVLVLDNLSRPGVGENLDELRAAHGQNLHAAVADIRDAGAVAAAVRDSSAVFHLAAQTAVTTSLADPVDDFEVNARGALNVLEAVRAARRRVPVIFASTNKVYGGLEDLRMDERPTRYEPADAEIAARGVGEGRPLDFCTPYGCSKGVADQYVLDYAKSYGLPTAVLRMSCIYGPRQFGTEDQGWVAHFLLRALKGEPISIYGDGKQVRDILHVRDAVSAYRGLLDRIEAVKGQAFNLGGGPRNAVSLIEVLDAIASVTGRQVRTEFGPWRTGDQLYFVADTAKLEHAMGWRAGVGWREGLADLARWLEAHRLDRRPPAMPQRVVA